MNEELKNFIGNMGVLCELWTVIFTSFCNQGMTHDEALSHTGAFMKTMLGYAGSKGDAH